MRRPRTLLALLALVALMASAGEQTTTYSAAPKAVKEVVKAQKRAKMLSVQQAPTRKQAPSADQFMGLNMYVNLTNSNEWAGYGIGPMVSIPILSVPRASRPMLPTCATTSWLALWAVTSSWAPAPWNSLAH